MNPEGTNFTDVNSANLKQENQSRSELFQEVDQNNAQLDKETIGRPGIEVVAGKIREMQKDNMFLWRSKIAELNLAKSAQKPTDPDRYLFELLYSAGLTEANARASALESKVHDWEVKKANACFSVDYIGAISQSGIDTFTEILPAINIWVSQFNTMCSCLGLNPNSPSAIDKGISILESYRLRLCPVPYNLADLMFSDGAQGTIELDVRYGGRSEFGVYFPARALLIEGGKGYRITHDNDYTKIHEDSHFLALQVKGEEGYFADRQLAIVGEGFAPIFELWFDGSIKTGQLILLTDILRKLDTGESPSLLRGGDKDASTYNFWESAKKEMLIREHSGTTKIAAEIMLLLKSNPHICMRDCFSAFLNAQSFGGFLNAIRELEPSDISYNRFNNSVTQLSKINRDDM